MLMRRITQIALAAVIAASVAFADASARSFNRQSQAKQPAAGRMLQSMTSKAQESVARMAPLNSPAAATMAKAPRKSADYTYDETPEGTVYELMSTYEIDSYWGSAGIGQGMMILVEAADGTLWIKGLVPGAYGTLFWVRADKTDVPGEYVVEQQLAVYYSGWDEYDEVARLEYDFDNGYVPASNSSFKVYFKDNKFSVEEDVIYGLVYLEGGEYVYEGDVWLSFSAEPMSLTAAQLPEGAEVETYALKHLDGAKSVEVAFVGDQVYFRTTDLVDGWFVGTISGNKVIIENEQFLGYSDYYNVFLYLITGSTYEAYDEYYDWYYLAASIEPNLVLDFDAEAKTLTAADGDALFINASTETVYYAERYITPEFKPFVEVAAVPADPEILYWWDYDDDYEMAELDFNIPSTDVDGNLLNVSKLNTLFYVDDEVFIFEPIEYDIDDDLVEVPYGYSDGYGIGTSYVLFYFQPLKTVGLQTVYRGGDVENYSNIVVYDIDSGETEIVTGIKEINDGRVKAVAAEGYYDTAGRQVKAGAKGFVVKTLTFADGSKKTYKVVRR